MAELTPNEIINKEFKLSLRGYDREQVDDFLQQVSERLYRALEEMQRMRAQQEDLRGRLQQYQQTEELMKNTLLLAERTAEESRQRAQQEASVLRRETEQQLVTERTALEEMRQQRLRLSAELRAVLHAHLSMLESQEGR